MIVNISFLYRLVFALNITNQCRHVLDEEAFSMSIFLVARKSVNAIFHLVTRFEQTTMCAQTSTRFATAAAKHPSFSKFALWPTDLKQV